MTDAEGNEVGSVELTEMQNGTLLVAKLTGLPEGAHGFHVHTAGLCEPPFASRSEEHTSELQSLMRISYAVFCLKKKNKQIKKHNTSLDRVITTYTNRNDINDSTKV